LGEGCPVAYSYNLIGRIRDFDLGDDRLTEQAYWENRWKRIREPKEIRRDTKHAVNSEIIKIFDAYLPQRTGLKILEIGGAPGQFLTYLVKEFGYSAHTIDYSTIGCDKMREAFEIANLDVTIYNRDIFADISDLPSFDIVFSMGFIEHFSDLDSIVGKHVGLIKKQGILLLGVPNYRGISQAVLKRLAPRKLSMHNLETMDIKNWESFEKKYGLKTIFKAYIGGFNPGSFRRCENRTLKNLLIRFFFKIVRILITDRFAFLRRLNSIYWSAYLLGIYRKV
jgi:2-polyprenyl-3-methyl-5-hydroxy-6-metoxy-1,4-benzoquinol methylase